METYVQIPAKNASLQPSMLEEYTTICKTICKGFIHGEIILCCEQICTSCPALSGQAIPHPNPVLLIHCEV